MRRIADGSTRARTPTGPKRPNRTYVFVVTALAVFLIGLIVWRSPVFGYVASTVIQIHDAPRSNDAPGSAIEQLRKEIADEDFLAAAMRLQSKGNGNLADQVATIQGSMRVESAEASGPSRFRISLLADSTSEATLILGQITNHYVAQSGWHADSKVGIPSNVEELESDRARSSGSESGARRALDQHVDRVFAIFVQAIDSLRDGNVPDAAFFNPLISLKASSSLKQVESKPKSIVNPEWAENDEKIKSLTSQYEQLLERRTEAHPEVQQLKSRIDQLARARGDLPKTVEPGNASDGSASPGSDVLQVPEEELGPKSLVINPKAMAASIATFNKLVSKYQAVRDSSHDSDRTNPVETPSAQVGTSARLRVSIVEQPYVATKIGGTPTPQKLIILGLVSCLIGGLAAWRATWRFEAAKFRSADQIERELMIPVTGVVSTSEPLETPVEKKLGDRISFGALRTCESILALIVVVIFLYTVFDSPFAGDLIGDPFGTISQIAAASKAT